MSHETLATNMVGAVMTVYERAPEPVSTKAQPPGPRRLPPNAQAPAMVLGPEKHLVTGFVRAIYFPPTGGMLFVLEVIYPTNELRGRGDIVTVGTGGPLGSMRYSMIDHPAEAEIGDVVDDATLASYLHDAAELARGAAGGGFDNLPAPDQAVYTAMASRAREILR